MYLFAQKVRSASANRGINAGLYRHEGTVFPEGVWTRPEREALALVTTQHPGHRVREHVSIAPGGNAVECFLDVIGPDAASAADVAAALEALRASVEAGTPPPVVVRRGTLTVAFGCNLGVAEPAAELDELAMLAIHVYEDTQPSAWRQQEPLRVLVEHDEEGFRFRLDDASAARVVAAGGTPTTVSIRHDVAADFRRTHGRLYPHVPEWLTALSREGVLELGGVRFADGDQVVGEWPDRG